MAKDNRITTADFLSAQQITYKGSKYQPVTHKQVIETIKEQLYVNNFTLVSEEYLMSSGGQRAIGKYGIKYGDGLDYMIAFGNSLDGSIAFRLATGSIVRVCSNGCIFGENNYRKKHYINSTGSNYILERLVVAIDGVENTMKDHLLVKQNMMNMEVNNNVRAQLIGDLYLNQNLIKAEQLAIIKQQIDTNVSYEGNKDSLWTLYNHTTLAVHDATPISWEKQHQGLGNYFNSYYENQLPPYAEQVEMEELMGIKILTDM